MKFSNFKKSEQLIRLINSKINQAIITELQKDYETSVGDIQKAVGKHQGNVSWRLSLLKANRLVKSRREGKHIYYSINYPEFERLNNILEKI